MRNIIERAVIISSGSTLELVLPSALSNEASFSTLAEAEAEHIRSALKRARGRIKGANGAASILGMKPSTLYTRMKKLGISPRESRRPE
jgi:transcriptional regulator of acetoin/glycerol metabolism